MLYIWDDRYRTTTLDVVLAPDDEAAGELARVCLASSPHYLGVEVWEEDRLVMRLAKDGAAMSPLVPPGEDPPNGHHETS
jgi:hypothetical protein